MSVRVNLSQIRREITVGLVICTAPAFCQNMPNLDRSLTATLKQFAVTGRIEATLEPRLGRTINPKLADLGRLIWFDKITGLHDDNTCGGCHSPANGFGDSQSIAIGVQNNNIAGQNRNGPRNQRRTPAAVNTAFYPALMWNGRFFAPSGDPFNNSKGFTFPPPEGTTRFPPSDPKVTHLLIAQGHLPPTELTEVAGFTGTAGTIGPDFDQFDDGLGSPVPAPDASGYRNEPIRQAVLARLNATTAYRTLFGNLFPPVKAGAPIDFTMFGMAIAEFEFTLVLADAPIDRYARGDMKAMSEPQKRGALIFFGKGRCVQCHTVSGQSNEMYSDFLMHVVGVPQIAPFFGKAKGNVLFDGPGQDEDFGLEQITGNPADRYKFRTSPLRNAAVQAAFFHNGAFTRLEDAIRFHLDASQPARHYDPRAEGVDEDLCHRMGPMVTLRRRLDPLLSTPIELSPAEFEDLVAFVRDGLLDERAQPQNLCKLIPASVPSGRAMIRFQGCPQDAADRRN
jgi:cytochrome c peroxidase